MSATVKYKGTVLGTVSNQTKTLTTKGKYLEDDVEITETGGGGSAVLETLQVSYTPSETAISDTQIPSQGYDGFDEAQISVAAIPSSYVGSGITRRDSTDMSVSGDTVTAPAGYYENAGSKSVANGWIGMPDSASGSSASVTAGTNTLTLSKELSITPVVLQAGYVSGAGAGNVNVSLTASVNTKAADTIHPSTSDQSIAASQYLTGAQTIKAVTLTNLLAENIKSGVTVEVGDSTDSDCVASITGTYSGGSSGKRYKTGTYTPAQTYNTAGNRAICTIAEIGFTPSIFILEVNNISDANQQQYALLRESYEKLGSTNFRMVARYSNSSGTVGAACNRSSWTSQSNYYLYFDGSTIYVRTATSYILPQGLLYDWIAIE